MKKGFTLLEILLVLALICVFCTLNIYFAFSFDRLSLKTQIDELYSACVALSQEAQISGLDKKLFFDIKNNGYYFDNDYYSLGKNICFGVLSDVKGPPSEPKNILKNPVTFKNNQIIFYKNGTIQSGTIYLIDKKKRYIFALTSGAEKELYLNKYFYETGRWYIIK